MRSFPRNPSTAAQSPPLHKTVLIFSGGLSEWNIPPRCRHRRHQASPHAQFRELFLPPTQSQPGQRGAGWGVRTVWRRRSSSGFRLTATALTTTTKKNPEMNKQIHKSSRTERRSWLNLNPQSPGQVLQRFWVVPVKKKGFINTPDFCGRSYHQVFNFIATWKHLLRIFY